MHKKHIKRNLPITQKIHSSWLSVYDNNDDKDNNNAKPRSARKKKWYPNKSKTDRSWDEQHSDANSSMSWPDDIEAGFTQKLQEQWDAIERTLYGEEDQVPPGPVFDECLQWRSQIPHLRIVGKNPSLRRKRTANNTNNTINGEENFEKDAIPDASIEENRLPVEDPEELKKKAEHKAAFESVLDILVEYVTSEILKENENYEELEDLPKTASAHGAQGSKYSANSGKEGRKDRRKSKSRRTDIDEIDERLEKLSIDMRSTNMESIDNMSMSSRLSDTWEVTSIESLSSRLQENTSGRDQNRLFTPETRRRNKLGKVFNQKIVVSPVPFVLSTRESFSTLKKTPVMFANKSFQLSKEPLRNLNSSFYSSAGKSSLVRMGNIQSAWQAPVCPTVWPKNVKLAPLNTPRLGNNKRRSSTTTSTGLPRTRRSLSPISKSALPNAIFQEDAKPLAILGKPIAKTGQSSKSTFLKSGWDYQPRNAAAAVLKSNVRLKKEGNLKI